MTTKTEFKYEVDDVCLYEGRICTIVSLDGVASASLDGWYYQPRTVQFMDNTRQSYVYCSQLTPVDT